MKRNWFDRSVEFFAPAAAYRRYQARLRSDFLLREYDAASPGRRTQGWRRGSSDAVGAIALAKKPIREITRDLTRNNPFAVSVTEGILSNGISTGIETVFRNANGTTNTRLTDAFKAWAESVDCDFSRSTTYYGIQELAMRSTVEAGEAIVLPVIEGGKNPRFCLKALEPDFIDDSRTPGANEIVVEGIRLDKNGKRLGYYLYRSHPGARTFSLGLRTDGNQSDFHSIENVFHVFRAERIGQLRGISWFAPVITMLKELDEFFDATLVKQKIASAFAGFIKDDPSAMSTGIVAKKNRQLSETIEPGILENLPHGTDIVFPSPPSANDFDPFTRSVLRAFSAGMKVPYEVVTGDLSGVNFSSGRMGWQEFGRKIEQWQWNMLKPQLLERVAMAWLQFQAVQGARTGGVYVTFVMPKRAMVDPVSETNATIAMIRSGIKSLPEAIREQGEDPLDKIKEISDFNEVLDKYGVVLDVDPRKMTKTGIAQSIAKGDDKSGLQSDTENEDEGESENDSSSKNPDNA